MCHLARQRRCQIPSLAPYQTLRLPAHRGHPEHLSRLSTDSGMPCRSKKLISDSKSATKRRLVRMCSNDICHVVSTALDAPPSRRSSPPSCPRSLPLLRSLSRNSSRYFDSELRGALACMYPAA